MTDEKPNHRVTVSAQTGDLLRQSAADRGMEPTYTALLQTLTRHSADGGALASPELLRGVSRGLRATQVHGRHYSPQSEPNQDITNRLKADATRIRELIAQHGSRQAAYHDPEYRALAFDSRSEAGRKMQDGWSDFVTQPKSDGPPERG